MSESSKSLKEVLSSVEIDRRRFVKRLITASAFSVPLTLAASLDGSPIREARAQQQSGGIGGGTPQSSGGVPAQSGSGPTQAVPEPSTLAILGGGVALLAYMRKRGLGKSED